MPVYRSLLIPLLAICACANPTAPESLPKRPPTLIGLIVARDVPLAAVREVPNIHVRSGTEECGTAFGIDAQTTIVVRGAAGRLRREGVDALVSGRTARVWTQGMILLSCPGQATAEAIELLD